MKTKNLIAVVVLVLSMVTSTFSQDGTWSLGPRIGLNFADVSNITGSESTTGLMAGITSTYSINEHSGLTIEALYSSEGYEVGSVNVDLDYLRIPVFYNVFFNDWGDAFRPKVYAGLAPGFILSAEREDNDISANISTFDLAVAGGLGFNYRLAPRIWLNTDLRAHMGFGDINDADDFVGQETSRNQVISLNVGVAFGLSKL